MSEVTVLKRVLLFLDSHCCVLAFAISLSVPNLEILWQALSSPPFANSSFHFIPFKGILA